MRDVNKIAFCIGGSIPLVALTVFCARDQYLHNKYGFGGKR